MLLSLCFLHMILRERIRLPVFADILCLVLTIIFVNFDGDDDDGGAMSLSILFFVLKNEFFNVDMRLTIDLAHILETKKTFNRITNKMLC